MAILSQHPTWVQSELPSGSRCWTSECGRYRLVASEMCYGVTMPRVWKVWFYRYPGGWHRVGERRSRRAALKLVKAHRREWAA